MNFSLKNKWVLITGASSGFGAAAAIAFGATGAKLLLGARRVDRLKKVAAESKKIRRGGSAFSRTGRFKNRQRRKIYFVGEEKNHKS